MPRWPLLLVLVVLASPLGLADEHQEVERTVDVELADQGCPGGEGRFCIRPAQIEMDEGHTLVLRVNNTGRVTHNLTFGLDTPGVLAKHGMNGTLEPNASVELRIPWSDIRAALDETGAAEFELECRLAGHATLGERLVIRVPSAQGGDERPQPGPGALLAVAAIAGLALWMGRRDAQG